MPKAISLIEMGNQIKVIYDDGTFGLAYPTVLGNNWVVNNTGGGGPGPGPGGLKDYWTGPLGITGTWEEHASYSRGGTDWPVGFGVAIPAPAAGTLVNYGNTDGAGLKSILIFDTPFARKLPASGTLMNGVYRETDAGDAPAASFVIQHLNSQVAAGHYNQGETIGFAGDTGSTEGQHLHAHLLAGTTIDDRRLDFMKFCD